MATLTVVRGQVWYALVPYSEDPAKAKERPVLVLGASPQTPHDDRVIVVAPITGFSESGTARNGDVPILNWRNCGLNKPSWVRARRVWGADPAAFSTERGCTGTVDTKTVQLVLTEFAGLFG